MEGQLEEAGRIIEQLRANQEAAAKVQGGSNLSFANPDASAPAAPAHILDGQVETLRTARDLPRMADDTIEQAPDGSLEKVTGNFIPCRLGPPWKTSPRRSDGKNHHPHPREGTHMEIIEEREKVEPPKEESTLKKNVEANLDDRFVPNKDAAELSNKVASEQGKSRHGRRIPHGHARQGRRP